MRWKCEYWFLFVLTLFLSLFVLSSPAYAQSITFKDEQTSVKQGGFITLDVSDISHAATQETHTYRLSIYSSNGASEWDFMTFSAQDHQTCGPIEENSGVFLNFGQILESHELYGFECHFEVTVQVPSTYNCNPSSALPNNCRVVLHDTTINQDVISAEFTVEPQSTSQNLSISIDPEPVISGDTATITATGCEEGTEVQFVWWRQFEINATCVSNKLQEGNGISDDDDCGDGDSTEDTPDGDVDIIADDSGVATFIKGPGGQDTQAYDSGEDGREIEYLLAAFCEDGTYNTKTFKVATACSVCPAGSEYDPSGKTCVGSDGTGTEATIEVCTGTQTCEQGKGCMTDGEEQQRPTPTPIKPPCLEWDEKDTDGDGDIDERTCLAFATAMGRIDTADPRDFINSLFSTLLGFAGGIAILLIIYAGYKILTSRGDPERLQDGKETMTSAIIGLLFIIFSMVILEVIGVDILALPGFNGS